jgi:hypothetical protein
MDEGMTDIQMGKMGNAAQFFSQLPFQEEQARSQRVNTLLGMGTQWAGRAPISTVTTGSSTRKGTEKTQGTSNTTGNATEKGPGFLSNFASNLGGLTAPGSTYGKMFGGRPPSDNTGYGDESGSWNQ